MVTCPWMMIIHNSHSKHMQTPGGKAARARAARMGVDVVTNLDNHRPCGGAPINSDLDSASDNHRVVLALEELEKQARKTFHPHLETRRNVPMDNHGSMIVPIEEHEAKSKRDTLPGQCNLSEMNLRKFTILSLVPAHFQLPLACLQYLDLSRNELWTLPSLASIPNVRQLNLSRNWFANLPESVSDLPRLEALDVSHNMLRSSQAALLIKPRPNEGDGSSSILQSLESLRSLDLTFNQKCGQQKLKDRLCKLLPKVDVKITVCFPRPEGNFVGACAAERDPSLLRSQLEPWPTTALRRRLVADFGEEPSSPITFPRRDVMDRLLELYGEEGNKRTLVKVDGMPVDESLCHELMLALREWKEGWKDSNQERLSIDANNYMILSSPASLSILGSRKRAKAEAKMRTHHTIWDLAHTAMKSVDADFASRYTALAVTHNFRGSPHIDRQNLCPFYGLSMGDFEEGTGGVMVECSARVVAHVNTKNRLGRVDGRYPHWVAPYDERKDRYSLIFYLTMGQPYQKTGPAIFAVPQVLEQ